MNLRKYLKVYKKFLHTSLASELEYKANILVDLVTAILSLIGSIFLLSIFFQAEDGIRDTSVTGVQTCALPIYIHYFEKK